MSHSVDLLTDPSPRAARTVGNVWSALVELAVLGFTAPLLYFPARVEAVIAARCGCDVSWLVVVALGMLALLWPVRRWLTGRWAAPLVARPLETLQVGGWQLGGWQPGGWQPGGWVLWFWFLVMLPVAIWAAPPPLREQYAWPRAYILVWNFSLFWTVLAHASSHRRLLGWAMVGWLAATQLLAIVAPFGMEARTKLPVIGQIQELIPRPLLSQFSGAESGFSTNQVAGVLLYVLPLLVAVCVVGLRVRGWRWWLLVLGTGWMGATMILSQSRGGLLGLLLGLLAMALLGQRRGWYALVGLVVVSVGVGFYLPPAVWDLFGDAPMVEAVGGIATVQNFRTTVWNAAMLGVQDFPFTGMGLGTFRVLVHMLYPLPGIPPVVDLAHAHNFFLQTTLDFGVPGGVAIVLLYVAATVQLVRLAHLPVQRAIWSPLPFLTPRVLAIGWMGCLVGQTVYSLFDAVAMGSKPNFVWWWWLALIFAAANYLLPGDVEARNEAAPDKMNTTEVTLQPQESRQP